MKTNRLWILVIAVLALAGLAACNGHLGRSHGSRIAIHNVTHTDVYTYNLPESAQQFTLELQFQASQGVYHWMLTDPDGQIVWQGGVEAPDEAHHDAALELTPGRWTLDVQMEHASGGYDIEWRSR